jgi:hypothetical protein
MNVEELKQQLKELFGKQVVFNKGFEKYAATMKNLDVNLIGWCKRVKDEEIKAHPSPKNRGILVFIKKIGSSNRCIVLKIKNGVFTEIHLADHDYYDRLRKVLGLKRDSI